MTDRGANLLVIIEVEARKKINWDLKSYFDFRFIRTLVGVKHLGAKGSPLSVLLYHSFSFPSSN